MGYANIGELGKLQHWLCAMLMSFGCRPGDHKWWDNFAAPRYYSPSTTQRRRQLRFVRLSVCLGSILSQTVAYTSCLVKHTVITIVCSLEMGGWGHAATSIFECALQNQKSVVVLCSHDPIIQKEEQRLTAAPLSLLLLWQRETQFSYSHLGALESSICLPFLEQYFCLVNDLGKGAMKVVKQSKVIINLLKWRKELKCEMREEKEKRMSQGHISLLDRRQVEQVTNKLLS